MLLTFDIVHAFEDVHKAILGLTMASAGVMVGGMIYL